MKQSVAVKLAGHTLNLRTEDEPQYVTSLADHFAERIEEIQRVSDSASAHQIALLAGLRVVDELFRLRRALDSIEEAVQTRVGHVLSLLEEHEVA